MARGRKRFRVEAEVQPAGASARFKADAFRKRISDFKAPGLQKTLERQEGRVTPGGRDFAERKIAILKRKLEPGMPARMQAPARSPQMRAPSASAPFGHSATSGASAQFSHPGRPSTQVSHGPRAVNVRAPQRVGMQRRRRRKPRYRNEGRPAL